MPGQCVYFPVQKEKMGERMFYFGKDIYSSSNQHTSTTGFLI